MSESIPQTSAPASATAERSDTLLKVDDLAMYFPLTSGLLIQRTHGYVHAIDGVSFSIRRGTTLGLVGESGSGKTTIGRCIVRLYKPTRGSMNLDGADLSRLAGNELRQV